jgi:uncharacterized cupin superfamily protein
MPKINIAVVPKRKGSGYPSPFDAPCPGRVRQRIGNAGGRTDFGVKQLVEPASLASAEVEFVYVLEGELMLIEDSGETMLRAGDCAAFPKGSGRRRSISKSARARPPTLHSAPTST